MNRHLELATHGHYASGTLSALEILVGEHDNITAMDCYVTKNFDLQKAVNNVVANNVGSDLVVVTDLFGGSVNNEFMKYISDRVFLIAGMNLPFLLELTAKLDSDMPTKELIQFAIEKSQDSLKFCNMINLSEQAENEDF